MEISFRQIEERDLIKKVEWYNNGDINKYLHYDKPFNLSDTLKWFRAIKDNDTRYENVIEIERNNEKSIIGIIGLFDIDLKNMKAGFYITIGEKEYQGKGIAQKATYNFLEHCFEKYNLNKIYLFTDIDNIKAQCLYEKTGFIKEGVLRQELYQKGKYIDRCYYGLLREEFELRRNSGGNR